MNVSEISKERPSEGHDFVSFYKAWNDYGEGYDLLRNFFGGLTFVFPGTSTVESDLSILNYEAKGHRCNI